MEVVRALGSALAAPVVVRVEEARVEGWGV